MCFLLCCLSWTGIWQRKKSCEALVRVRLKYNLPAISLHVNEVEYVELGEEVLPALAIGIHRLSDGVQGLKAQLGLLNRQIETLREESTKLTQLLGESKKVLDEERAKLVERYEELVKVLDRFMGRLNTDLKSVLDLGLGGMTSKLSGLLLSVDSLAKELQVHRLEERDRLLEAIEDLKRLGDEVPELKAKISELNMLVYSLELRMRSLEDRVAREVTEIKLLMLQPSRREAVGETADLKR